MDNYGKYVKATTIPLLFTMNINTNNSINMYIEYQDKSTFDYLSQSLTIQDNSKLQYISLTYSLFSKLSLSYFYDIETQWYEYLFEGADNITNPEIDSDWIGYELGYNINSTNQISVFYGSQKGGLVCANGICAQQPDFTDGVKITFRSLF